MQKKIVSVLGALLLILFLFGCGDDPASGDSARPILAETAEITAAEDVVETAEKALFAGYAAFIEETMRENGIPGVAAAVVQESETVFAQGFGWRDVGNYAPVTPETLFHIGSINKSMTAMMIAALVDEGLLDWDMPVVEIYPDFALSSPEATEMVTIRHLLSMRGGIPGEAEDVFDVDNGTAEDVFAFLAQAPLLGMPGDAFSYSNLSNSVSGYLGVLAAGGAFGNLYDGYARLLKERVLDPIGMETAVVRVSEAVTNPNYGKSYILNNDGQPVVAEPEDFDGDPLAPSGSLKANAFEMALYVNTQLNYGLAPNGTRIVSEKNLTETWKPYSENYGMGWEVSEHQGVEIISHEGSFDNYLGIVGFAPELDIGFVILTNSEEASETLIEEGPLFLVELFLRDQ